MFEAISNSTNVNQVNPNAVEGQSEVVRETTTDVAEGKVNPVESLPDSAQESDLSAEGKSEDVTSRGSAEGRIIDLVG
jgi:hypothetical protein